MQFVFPLINLLATSRRGFLAAPFSIYSMGTTSSSPATKLALDYPITNYPDDTKFVVLPVDLRGLNKGLPDHNIRRQHKDLAQLANENPGCIVPFVHIDPRSSPGVDGVFNGPDALSFIQELCEEGINGVRFHGIKLYPPLGYSPNDPKVDRIFAYANERKLPITVHCMSRGGTWADDEIDRDTLVDYTAPASYIQALSKYPNMRLCLAHFGGNREWNRYLARNADDERHDLSERDWVSQIATMMQSYSNLYADISYTFLRYKEYDSQLVELLHDPKIASQTLFGSDYYMSEFEKLHESELMQTLYEGLGDSLFRKIAHENPQVFLGTCT